MKTWTQYEPEGNAYIPIEQWGHDHWSTLAYLETRAVDAAGVIDNRRMRCNARLHREFAHSANGAEYPTRLKEGTQERHDDWSCLEDMAVAGLLVASFREVRRSEIFGGSEGRVQFTKLGLEMAAQLRQHKATGGTYATFAPLVLSSAS